MTVALPRAVPLTGGPRPPAPRGKGGHHAVAGQSRLSVVQAVAAPPAWVAGAAQTAGEASDMTHRKDLKARARDRAARTGESYTTARRQVLAVPGLVPGYPATGGGTHHESTLLAHLLGSASPSEAMLCGLAGGIGFLYAVFEYRGLPPILTVVAQHHPDPWIPAALDRLGIPYRIAHSSTPRAATTALLADLDAGRPVHCLVDRGVLPWHRGALPGDPYPVVVAGRDGGDLLVDDRAPRPRRIPIDVFVAAWSAYRKGRHQRLTVSPSPGTTELPAAIRSATAMTVAHLTGPVLGNAFDVNFGLSGMRRLADQLRSPNRHGWSRRFAAPGALAFAGRRLHDCLTSHHTAPGGTRPLYADFLDEAAGVLSDPVYAAAAVEVRRSGAQWSAVAALAHELSGPSGEAMADWVASGGTGPAPDPARPDLPDLRPGLPDLPDPRPDLPDLRPDLPDLRPDLLPELADRVDAARSAEEAAVALLSRFTP